MSHKSRPERSFPDRSFSRFIFSFIFIQFVFTTVLLASLDACRLRRVFGEASCNAMRSVGKPCAARQERSRERVRRGYAS